MMKIVVAVKTISERIPTSIEDNQYQASNKYVLDPFSEVALEQGLRLLDDGIATELVVVTVSPSVQALRAAMAMGAPKAVQIPHHTNDCALVAELLVEAVRSNNADLVLLGKQSGDGDNHQVAQRLAQILNWPMLTAIDQMVIDEDNIAGSGLCAGGRVQYVADLPAVISADLRLCAPRFATLPNLMKARRQPIEQLDVDIALSKSSVTLVEQQRPVLNRKGITLEGTEQLAQLLQRGNKA